MTAAEAAAITYLRAGLSVIPTRPEDKRPCILWKEYQTRRATEEDVSGWWRRWPRAGVAIVCGAVSGVVVLDGDPRNGPGLAELAPRLPRTPTVETGGGGCHHYFAAPAGTRGEKVPALLPGLDVQGEASYVVAPPTIHPSGRPYRWLPGLAFGEVPLAPLPAVVRHLLALHRQPEEPRDTSRARRAAGNKGPSFESVLASLQGVHRSGRGWLARCPCHDDREPSLSVGEGDAGRLLIHCFAGCTFADVVRALDDKRPAP